MKLVSFDHFRVGVLRDAEIVDLTELVPAGLDAWPEVRMNWLIAHFDEVRADIEAICASAPASNLNAHRLLAPLPQPNQVFALPANFSSHLGELGSRAVTKGKRTAREQGFFLKATGSVSGPEDPIALPKGSERRFDHECEVAVIIGKTGRDIPRHEVASYLFGYAPLVDVSLRIERGEFEEERSMRKSFSNFTPMGPAIVTADEVGPIDRLESRLSINGEVRQSATLDQMIVGVEEAIEIISSVVELRAGDVIAMGTPSGVGPIAPGDVLEIDVDRIGDMHLSVVERDNVSPRPY